MEARPVGEWALMVRGQTPEGEEIALMGACPEGESTAEATLETSEPLFFVSPDAVVCGTGLRLGGVAIAPGMGAQQLRDALQWLWEALPEAGTPAETALPRSPAEQVAHFSGFTPRGESILGPNIAVDPAPTSGLALDQIGRAHV